jgi:hypothetical protein
MTRSLTVAVLPILLTGLAPTAPAQGGPFIPGGQTLFRLDPAATAVGEFPDGIKLLKGTMSVVMKNGVPMLQASSESEFLITLPAVLPRDFTLEFDLVPKTCCNPEDLSFEGTAEKNRGSGSAHVVWHREILSVVGGGEYFEAIMPEDLKTATSGKLTRVVVSFEATTVKLYTNGRRLYTLTDRKFVRGRVLRVFLGAYQGEPVYLAGLRLAAATGAQGITAASGGTRVLAAGAATGPAPRWLNVDGSPVAAWLVWDPVAGATSYSVRRSVAGSNAWTVLTSPDGPRLEADLLPDPTKTYTYQVESYQRDGSYGVVSANYTPLPHREPARFSASPGWSPGEVQFVVQVECPNDGWLISKLYQLVFFGPGTSGVRPFPEGASISLSDPGFCDQRFIFNGVPSGTHTWQVAVDYQPGGILTPSSAWRTATAVIP